MTSLHRMILLSLLFILPLNSVLASSTSLCEPSGVALGFFNGVLTTEKEADEALGHFRAIHGKTNANGEVIQYEVLYNYTNGFEDFVETFEQRLLEQDGLLEGRFELFFEAMQGGGHWWDVIIDAVPSAKDIVVSFSDWIQAATIDLLTGWAANPPTIDNYAKHQTRIDAWGIEGKKLLFVAHSQGNLFVNSAYDYALSANMPDSSVKVVHIAPASPSLRGEYVLADQDLVINGLRLFGSVADVTDYIPIYPLRKAGLNGKTDLLGHGLLEIYLNPHLDISNSVKSYINEALNSLETPVMPSTKGFFSATLDWRKSSDVRLNIYEPNGYLYNYWGMTGTRSGYFEEGSIPEEGGYFRSQHYYASCDANTLQTGKYQIVIAHNLSSKSDRHEATLEIATWNKGVLATHQALRPWGLGQERYTPYTVTISKDPDTNEYSVSIEEEDLNQFCHSHNIRRNVHIFGTPYCL